MNEIVVLAKNITFGGYVYLLGQNGDSGMFKIGVTKSEDITKRIKKLQTGNANEIICIHKFHTNKPFKLEKMLHNYYASCRQESEWFLLNNEQVGEFIERCEKFQAIIDALKDNPFF